MNKYFYFEGNVYETREQADNVARNYNIKRMTKSKQTKVLKILKTNLTKQKQREIATLILSNGRSKRASNEN